MDLSRYFVNEEYTATVAGSYDIIIPKGTSVISQGGMWVVTSEKCLSQMNSHDRKYRYLTVPSNVVSKEWDNENRNRRYGVRRGDIVKIKIWGRTPTEYRLAEVVDYYGADNNAVTVKDLDGMHKGIERKEVAEWCEIVTKVEDR